MSLSSVPLQKFFAEIKYQTYNLLSDSSFILWQLHAELVQTEINSRILKVLIECSPF